MFRILLILLVPVAIAGTLIYLFIIRGSVSVPTDNYGSKEVPLTTTFSGSDQVDASASPLITKNSTVDVRVLALESMVVSLNKKIDILTATLSKLSSPVPSISPVTTPNPISASSSGPKQIYIPIGYGGSSVATSDFESIGSQEITIDSSNYSGYKQAVLEVNFRINNGNGSGQARLFNSTDGTALLNSVVSTTSGNYSTITSGGFSLNSGSKKYTVQLKSSTGYSVDVQLARLRIDF